MSGVKNDNDAPAEVDEALTHVHDVLNKLDVAR